VPHLQLFDRVARDASEHCLAPDLERIVQVQVELRDCREACQPVCQRSAQLCSLESLFARLEQLLFDARLCAGGNGLAELLDVELLWRERVQPAKLLGRLLGLG
jgi:hypothetical protein